MKYRYYIFFRKVLSNKNQMYDMPANKVITRNAKISTKDDIIEIEKSIYDIEIIKAEKAEMTDLKIVLQDWKLLSKNK